VSGNPAAAGFVDDGVVFESLVGVGVVVTTAAGVAINISSTY
jgi:hypothetical protein